MGTKTKHLKVFFAALVAGITVSASALAAVDLFVAGGGGSARFLRKGEHLYVFDQASDGHSAVAEYWWDGDAYMSYLWASGYGVNSHRNFSKPESARIHIRACLGEAGTGRIIERTCSERRHIRAGDVN
ncbi:hypothetical protein [Sorangium sp. So ce385]|uniref:hypothetical protein n=1 Tax=Sorangium sp. So ce385 TaxID=3133308 RepID=UPI003F5C5BF3